MVKKKKNIMWKGQLKDVPQILNAHAGQRGNTMGTYITYIKDGITKQGFVRWDTDEFHVVIEDLERVVK